MDDMKLLQDLRAGVPEPDAERLAPLRGRLVSAATGRRRARSLALRALIGGALAAGLAAAVVVAVPFGGSPAPSPVPAVDTGRPGDVVVLERAALVAERRQTTEPRPDQWVYTRVRDQQPADGQVTIREEWIRYDGKQTAGRGEDGRIGISDVPPDPDDDDLSPQAYRAKLMELPTDPDELLAHVSGDRHWIDKPREEGVPRGSEPPDARAYRVLMLYLKQQAVMPPKVEAAIYRALARIPGVRISLGMHDAQGREAIGVYFENEPGDTGVVTRYQLLDPDTYRLLEDRTVWHRAQYAHDDGDLMFEAGSVFAVTMLADSIVDEPGQTS
ncbi:hypothetical protein GBF35_01650 [Nonomuraea phyllanthi]|nr:hypothetical protein GBF35_01650 [Nonomuraea phyllanthi]